MISRWCCGLACVLLSGAVQAHAYSPMVVSVQRLEAGAFLVSTKMPAAARVAMPEVTLVGCRHTEGSPVRMSGTDQVRRMQVHCGRVPERLRLSAPTDRTLIVRYAGLVQQDTVAAHAAGVVSAPLVTASVSPIVQMSTFFLSGLRHIAAGVDHLAFVLLLVLGAAGARLLLAITCFTLGHTASLAASSLLALYPPARWVEPAIALSIVYMAYRLAASRRGGRRRGPDASARAWPVLLIGLLHGFGFSGALRDSGLPRDALLAPLLGFNLGVEVGQLIFVALVLSGWRLCARIQSRLTPLAPLPTYAIGSVAFMWFLQRAL